MSKIIKSELSQNLLATAPVFYARPLRWQYLINRYLWLTYTMAMWCGYAHRVALEWTPQSHLYWYYVPDFWFMPQTMSVETSEVDELLHTQWRITQSGMAEGQPFCLFPQTFKRILLPCLGKGDVLFRVLNHLLNYLYLLGHNSTTFLQNVYGQTVTGLYNAILQFNSMVHDVKNSQMATSVPWMMLP
jgi:hypothetical protein